ncbi:MAG: hypothetical protein JNG50_03765 [Mogibacterium sp.]|uniref:hypothetical protein n=1 Tax=Mogibacterium sp. TaxID=2049035 RepID=UPI001A3EA4A5|nr:hypothetical protein [Mogibacterium sp.]MBL6468597.1 hypothetical protein [Mogibacterium sp.]
MYNFVLAFVICAFVYVIGEWVSTATKAWVPSVFVTAVVLLIGYWTVLPKELVTEAGLIPFANTIGIYLLITHIGTIISLKQLMQQWKTVVICLVGLGGMLAIGYFVAPMFMDKTLVIAGLPPLTGGIVAATTMSDAAKNAGLTVASVFAIAMYCVQGFAGYPLTALCLQKEGQRLLKEYRSGNVVLTDKEKEEMASIGMTAIADDSDVKKLLPKLPDKWNSAVVMLGKLGFVAWIASQLGMHTPVSGVIWALVLGIVATTIGFLESNLLNRANSYWILMFALMMYVFDGLKNCTPAMLKTIIGPMVILIIIGVIGMAITVFIISKVLKISFPLAFANGLTALYGFPCDAIITEATCNALGQTEEEKSYLMSKMFPSMIVGGFVTVTITSVLIAGVFAQWL